MTATRNDTVERFAAHHQALVAALPAGDAAGELRRQGLSAFVAQGLPTTRHEDWKYTNLRPLQRRDFASALDRPPAPRPPPRLPAIDGLTAWRAVFVDGQFEPSLSDSGPAPDGVTIRPLAGALQDMPPALAQALSLSPALARHSFAALNTALLHHGLWIQVAPGAQVAVPLHLVFFSRGGDTALATHPRVVLGIGAQARMTLIEQFAGEDDATGFTNALTQVRLGAGATVDHYRLQQEAVNGFHIAGIHVDQQRDSHYASHLINLGGALVRNDIAVHLAEPGASTLLNGFYMAAGRQHVDNHTLVDHLAPHTTSEETYRGVLSERGRAVFNGKAVVHPGAAKTCASQSNRNLLLSASAEIDTKPELEIYADDVQCSHGATVGQLDEDALFYLLSRGLDRRTARSLLTFAFADEVIARLGIESLRRYIEGEAAARLPDSEQIREFV